MIQAFHSESETILCRSSQDSGREGFYDLRFDSRKIGNTTDQFFDSVSL